MRAQLAGPSNSKQKPGKLGRTAGIKPIPNEKNAPSGSIVKELDPALVHDDFMEIFEQFEAKKDDEHIEPPPFERMWKFLISFQLDMTSCGRLLSVSKWFNSFIDRECIWKLLFHRACGARLISNPHSSYGSWGWEKDKWDSSYRFRCVSIAKKEKVRKFPKYQSKYDQMMANVWRKRF